MATRKVFTLVLVRHAEGVNNIDSRDRKYLKFVDDKQPKTINCPLTEKGLAQASMLAERLKNRRFDSAMSSDYKRAIQTADMIMNRNDSINNILQWKTIRERTTGDFEAIKDLEYYKRVGKALFTAEDAVKDRSDLTWRPPNGESVLDLRNRVFEFLQKLQKNAIHTSTNCPEFLVVSHSKFMKELFYILNNSFPSLGKQVPLYRNTAVAEYNLSTSLVNNKFSLEDVTCNMLSCTRHLSNCVF